MSFVDVITIVLYTVVILVALLLIGLILVQQSKGGGFGSAFGGAGESVFGAHAGTHLTKLTVITTTVFFVLTLALAVITGHREKPKSVVEINKELMAPETKPLGDKKTGVSGASKAKPAKSGTVTLDESGEKIPLPVMKKDIKKKAASPVEKKSPATKVGK